MKAIACVVLIWIDVLADLNCCACPRCRAALWRVHLRSYRGGNLWTP